MLLRRYAAGIDQRIAHAGLRRQVHDVAEALLLEKRRSRRRIRQIERDAAYPAAAQARRARALERDIVVRVEVVDADDVDAVARAVAARGACR